MTFETLAVEVLAVDVVVEVLLALEALPAQLTREDSRCMAAIIERVVPDSATAEWWHPAT